MRVSTGAESDLTDQARAFQPTLGIFCPSTTIDSCLLGKAAADGHFVTLYFCGITIYREVISKRSSGGAGCKAADRRLGGILHTDIRRC